MKNKKAQAAVEYLVLTSLSLIILMVLLTAAYSRISSSEKQMDLDSAERAVARLKEAADFVYIHGDPTKLEVSVYFPVDIDPINSYIANKTINLGIWYGDGHTDVWMGTRGNVRWEPENEMPSREGYYIFYVESTPYGGPDNGTIIIHE
jgi:uncharacterized protein (UPF0333 family)